MMMVIKKSAPDKTSAFIIIARFSTTTILFFVREEGKRRKTLPRDHDSSPARNIGCRKQKDHPKFKHGTVVADGDRDVGWF